MSEWIKHDGKGMPVDGDTLVDVRFKCAERSFCPALAKQWTEKWWAHDESSLWGEKYHIDAYRIIDNKED